MEQLDEGFVGSTWTETEAIHEEAPPPTDIGQQQQAAIDGSQGEAQKLEPIRNRRPNASAATIPAPAAAARSSRTAACEKGACQHETAKEQRASTAANESCRRRFGRARSFAVMSICARLRPKWYSMADVKKRVYGNSAGQLGKGIP